LFDYYSPESIIAMLGLVMVDKGEYFLGQCPFHADTNPSFSIKKEGYFKCFSCGKTGNIYQLIKHITGKTAKQFLGIDDYESFEFMASLKKEPDRSHFPDFSKIVQVGDTVDCYSNKACKDYLNRRGINKEFVDFFKLSYADYVKYNDTLFYDRLIIPIYRDKNLVGIEGRDVTGKQNPKVLYCRGSKVDSIFNLDSLSIEEPIIITEGVLDTVKIWQNISKNVCSIFGVALSNKQVETIDSFKKVILFPDGDEAGIGVIEELYEVLNLEFEVAIINDKDPNDATVEELRDAIDNRVTATKYFIKKEEVFEKKNYEWE
jgi:DNA primase